MKLKVMLLCCLAYSNFVCALVAGSEDQVSIQSHIDFPSAGLDNTMLGFGWFKNGFSFEDASTTCTFNSVFPVSGTINMQGGSLNLAADLHFVNILNIASFGSVNGQSYAIYFPSNVNTLPNDADTIQDTTLFLSNDLTLSSTLSFMGTTTIKGNGHTIFLSTNGGLQLLDDAHLILQDVDIKNVGSGNIALANDNAHITFDDTNLYFDSSLVFDTGSFLIKDDVHFYGSQMFKYDSARTSTIQSFGLWQIHDDMDFAIGKKTSPSDANPLWFEDSSSVLRLSNCHLTVLDYGFDLLRGTIAYDAQVSIDTVGTTTDKGLIIGNGNAADDPVILFDSGAAVRLDTSQFTFNTGSPNVLKTGAQKAALLSRNIGSNLVILQDLTVPSMKIEMLESTIPPMVIASGKTIEYHDTLIVLPGAEFDVTSGRREQLAFLLSGNDSIFFTKGTLPLGVNIENTGNRIMGNGNVTGPISLKDSNAQLISELDGEFNTAINMHGGYLQLDDDLRFGVNVVVTGSGIINLQEYSLHMPPVDLALSCSLEWQGQNAVINLNNHISLSSTCTINGVITINGKGNVLDLGDTGGLYIAENSTLILKDIRLEGVKGTNVSLADGSSYLKLDNMLWLQSDDYTFGQGSIMINHDVQVVGQKQFIYESICTSTVSTYATLKFTDNSTLKIGKLSSLSPEPIYFEDSSAQLLFDDATFYISNAGLTLTRGQLTFNHMVNLDMDATSTANGLIIGTNISGEDMSLLLDANTTWNFNSGYFVYNNFASDGITASGNLSARIVRAPGTYYYAFTDMDISNFINEASTLTVTPIQVSVGKTVSLNNMNIRLAKAQFILNNVQQSLAMSKMQGNASVLVDQASALPFPLFVSGTNNVMRGSGAIAAPIFLQDNATELTFDLQGELRSSIQLNGGTLLIDSDLDFGSDAHVYGQGTINVGGQKITLGATDMDWTATAKFVSDGGIIEFNARVSFDTTTTISGTLLFDGNGNSLEFKDNAKTVIEDGATVIYRNLRLENIEEKHFTCLGPNSKMIIDNSVIILGNDLTFDEGSITFVNQVDVIGSHTFSYDSAQTSTIKKNSLLHISDNVLLKVGKTNATIDEPIHFEDRTSVLSLDDCSFFITSSGMQFSNGTIRVDREVEVDMDSTSTKNGLVLGNGQVDDTLTFELSPGATVRFKTGHTVYNVQNPNAIVSLSPASRFVRANNSVLHANYPVSLSQMTLDHSAHSITTLNPGAYLSYDNTTFIIPGAEFNVTGLQTSSLAITLVGDGELNLNRGSYPLGLIVSGQNNLVHGNGNLSGPVILANSNAELQWALNGALQNTLSLNNGTLKLLQNIHIARGVLFDASGVINIEDNRFALGSKELNWSSDITYQGSVGEISFDNDVYLSGNWTFSGSCVLNGNGNTLYLGDSGQIDVAISSTLTMKNMFIRDIAADNIRCLDDEGLIILDMIDWLQDDMFTFSYGAMQWNNQVTMHGTSTFAYQTTRTSTLLRQSTLSLESGFTFTYDPVGSTAQDLIVFEDDSSTLQLINAQLLTGLQGMQFKNGAINIVSNATIAADAIIENDNIIQEGEIIIGTQSASDDVLVTIANGATLTLSRGRVIYKNTDLDYWKMNNELSTFALMAQTTLDLKESLDLGIGRLEVSKQSSIEIVTTKQLIGSLFELESA